MESDIPQFTVSKYLKSVTEDSQTARTTDSGEGADERKVIWPDVASVPYVSSRTDSDSAKTAEKKEETSSNSNDDIQQDNQDHSELTDPATSSELSDEDLEHLRVKSKGSTGGEEDTFRDKDPKVEQVGDAPDLNRQGVDEVERQTIGDHMDKGDGLELLQVKSKAPTEEGVVNSGVEMLPKASEVDQKLTDQGETPDPDYPVETPDHGTPDSEAGRKGNEKMGKEDYREQVDEEKENLEATLSAEDVAKMPNVERAEEHLELDRQKVSVGDNLDGAVKSHSDDNTVQGSEVKKPTEGEPVEREMKQETRNKEQEMLRKQEEQKAAMAEETKQREKQERLQRLESLRKELEEVERSEKMEAERVQKNKEEQLLKPEMLRKQQDKGGHKVKMSDDQLVRQKIQNGKGNVINNMRKEEGQVKKKEKPQGKVKAGILDRKIEKHPEKREKVQVTTTGKPSDKVHVQQPNDGKVPVNNKQEQASLGKGGSDEDDERKLKGAKLDKEEAELKRKLELLSEERKRFEKMAEEYKIDKPGKQPKIQKEQEHTQQRRVKESPKSPVKEQEVPAKVDQGMFEYYLNWSTVGAQIVLVQTVSIPHP